MFLVMISGGGRGGRDGGRGGFRGGGRGGGGGFRGGGRGGGGGFRGGGRGGGGGFRGGFRGGGGGFRGIKCVINNDHLLRFLFLYFGKEAKANQNASYSCLNFASFTLLTKATRYYFLIFKVF